MSLPAFVVALMNETKEMATQTLLKWFRRSTTNQVMMIICLKNNKVTEAKGEEGYS